MSITLLMKAPRRSGYDGASFRYAVIVYQNEPSTEYGL